MLTGLDGCRSGTGKTQGPKSQRPRRLLVLIVVLLIPLLPVSPSWAQTFEEKEYRDSFSTDFFFPYLDYNEKDGVIPGLEWNGSNFTGEHRLSFRGGIGTKSGK
ncbi:MAG: hypothetical protein PVJ70_13800, partial [Syntrophobacterales bacterium]